jgi:lipid-A-disaccharide synthase-like uncharacterized protein
LLAACLIPWVDAPAILAQPLNATDQGAVTTGLAGDRARIIDEVKRTDLTEAEVLEWIAFAEEIKKHAKRDLTILERLERAIRNPWVLFGFAAQGIFMLRFVVQLISSERKKRSHIPVAFWYLSLTGGLMLFVYALVRRDPVFVFGQGLGIIIYARNLMLIRNRSARVLNLLDDRADRNRAAAAPVNSAESP